MTGKQALPPEVREEVIHALVAVLNDNNGVLPEFAVSQIAEYVDRDRATIYRLGQQARQRRVGRQGAVNRQEALTLTRQQRAVLAASPTLHKGYEDLKKTYPNIGSYTRLWRAVRRLPPGDRSVICGRGPVDMDRLEIKIKVRVEGVNARNVIDQHLMDLLVVPEGTRHVERPWLTSLLDEYTRLGKGADFYFGAPNAVRTVAVIAAGVMLRVLDGVNIGGRFDQLHHDNGKELTSKYKHEFERKLRLFSSTNPAYSPGWDGKIEAYHKDVSQSFCAQYPGSTTGPKYHFDDALQRQPFVPKKIGQFLTEAEARTYFQAWLDDRNRSHRFAELGGRTPLEAWKTNDAPLDFPADEDVLRALLRTESKQIDHRGVHHKVFYKSKALSAKTGRLGIVKYLPGDPSHVWVLIDNQHILAWHEDLVPVEEEDRLLSARRRQRQRAQQTTRDAAELLNERLRLLRETGRLLPLSAVELPRRPRVTSAEEIAAFGDERHLAVEEPDEGKQQGGPPDEDAELEAFDG